MVLHDFGNMSSASWITSLSCSSLAVQVHPFGDTSTSTILHWLRFIFLSPCPQRALLSSIDILFLLAIFALAIQRLCSRFWSHRTPDSRVDQPLLPSDNTFVRTTLWFKLSLIVTVLLALSYTIVCILTFSRSTLWSWKVVDGLFYLIQAITYGVIAILLVHEKRAKADRHPLWLRAFWIANFVVITLFLASGIIHLINLSSVNPDLELDDILSFISFFISVIFLTVAINGTTGIVATTAESEPTKKTEAKLYESLLDTSNVSKYASASFISKAFWFWMNPLLKKGYKSPLHADDVPTLSPQHRAERMSELFEVNWPKPQEACGNRVRTTLLRCFWKDIAFTAFLAFMRYSFMYVGPVLIQKFVDYTAGKSNSKYEGYYLVAILFFAKFVEVLAGHQFNFHSQKLGMLMRSTIITALYKKGLRLSCSSRQAHGVGQIVNYMAVDAQQLSDVMLQIHSLWVMPMQVIVALGILYYNIGISAVAALVVLFTISILTVLGNSQVNRFQFNLMKERDVRLKATNEMLSHMRVVKFQAWEEYFSRRIQSFRDAEYGWLSKFNYTFGGTIALLWSAPGITAVLTFGSAVLLGIELNAGMVFTAMSLFRMLQEPIRNFPQSMVAISQAMISLERLDKYMNSKELVDDSVDREDYYGNKIAVKVEDGTFSWDDEGAEPVVKNLNFEVKKGELAAIVGTVGSGKSSLLASVLGEMQKITGKVKVVGTTAYVAQSSWIQNGTIQENILFGLPMDREKYREVIRVCSLEQDLAMMEYGDQTEIGEGGINISGGQKQRIQLARAVYQDRDIYILDDVLSAVDAHTGSAIYKEYIRGILKDKTILLVTHQVDFLHNVDLILVMKNGTIVQSGKHDDLLESGMDFKALVDAHESSMELVEAGAISQEASPRSAKSSRPAKSSSFKSPEEKGVDKSSEQPESGSGDGKIISEEEKETGRVSWHVYKVYFTEAFGWLGALGVVLLSTMWQGTLVASDYWLAYETSEDREFNRSLFIEVYGIIVAASMVLIVVRSGFTALAGLKTSQNFFSQMLHSVLHAPMSFFDTTPSGRILSRASADQTNVDILLPMSAYMALAVYITLVSIIIITCQYAWPTVFFLIPLGWLNLWYRDYFLSSSRELTRLDSVLKAPVIHHFSESISGVTTIRSFKKQERFWIENINRVNANLRMDFHNNGSKEWLGFRLELIGSFILCISTIFMIVLPASIIKPENIGLSLSYGLTLNETLFWALYGSCFVENGMVAVERIKQFTRLPSEAQWRKKECLPSLHWPTHGNIELKDLQVRYRPNTPLVLKGITLNIRGGEKIGVVGRTGGGKSTLIQVLFRLVEPSAGKIVIDDIDISSLGLHDLRSRFGIIPQEPVLFEGTIRSNIDPIGRYSDEEIWKSLERCQLKDVVAAKPEKLDTPVVDNGENWSVGQRQLICLGRVLLKHCRLLFMDEATASVDSQTDVVIQKVVREDFSAGTIISIAHRIPTVMDCDKVLVLDAGLAVEYDHPARLLERPSLFAALVKEYANRSSEL